MLYYFSPEQRHIRFKGDLVKGALYTEVEVKRFFGDDAFKHLEKLDIPTSHTFRNFGVRFINDSAYFHNDGTPKHIKIYYDKRFPNDCYTAIFTKTAKMLDGYHRAGLALNSIGMYYHFDAEPNIYHGKRLAWEDLPAEVKNAIMAEYKEIHHLQ